MPLPVFTNTNTNTNASYFLTSGMQTLLHKLNPSKAQGRVFSVGLM